LFLAQINLGCTLHQKSTMQDTRLWQVFVHFSLKDLRELAKCVRSPYFNQREYVVILFGGERRCFQKDVSQ